MRSISCRVHTTSKGEIFPLNKAFRFRLRCASAFPAPFSPLPSAHCPLPSVCAAHALAVALLSHLVGWPLPSASSTASFSLPLHFSLLAMHCGLCGSWLRLRVFAAVDAEGGSGGGAAGLRLVLCCAFVAIVKLGCQRSAIYNDYNSRRLSPSLPLLPALIPPISKILTSQFKAQIGGGGGRREGDICSLLWGSSHSKRMQMTLDFN